MRFTVLLIAFVSSSLCAAQESIYPGYTWLPLGNDVFIHSQDDPLAGPVDGNSTVILGDEAVMVVDTHINPAVARAVIGKIRAITDKPVTHVVNTHWHDDHTNGNHAYRETFPDAAVIAHRATLKSLLDEWQPMEKQRRDAYASVDVARVLSAARELEADDPGTAIEYRVYAGYVEALRPELATMQLVYPEVVFGDELVYDLGNRRVHLQWLGRGNTDGDIVAWLPEDRILITGDLVVAPVPFAFDSPMQDWVTTMVRLEEFDAAVIVPGHGRVQRDTTYISTVRELLGATIDAVQQAHDDGVSYENVADAVDLSSYRRAFTNDDALREWAWRAYFIEPGAKSAWASLGYALPE